MKILSWNVRGLGNSRAIKRLWNLLKRHSHHLIFLMETKLHKTDMERVSKSLGYHNGIDYRSQDSRCGLGLFWKPDCKVLLRSLSYWHIDVDVQTVPSTSSFCFTGFYGPLSALLDTDLGISFVILAASVLSPGLL